MSTRDFGVEARYLAHWEKRDRGARRKKYGMRMDGKGTLRLWHSLVRTRPVPKASASPRERNPWKVAL
jgi:hypothetical protein